MTGPAEAWPASAGSMITGVTITTSSVLVLVSSRLLNSTPRIGICERPGTRDMFSRARSSISPAMTKLCPSASSTSVSMRRLASAGMLKPDRTTPLARSMVETSGLTCILMVLRAVTRGRNVSLMPNSRNMIVTAPALAPPCTTGTGNSPPTWKARLLAIGSHQIGLRQDLQHALGAAAPGRKPPGSSPAGRRRCSGRR